MTIEERVDKLCEILIELMNMLPDNTTCNGLKCVQEEIKELRYGE